MRFVNRTIPGTALIETALTGDPLYLGFYKNTKKMVFLNGNGVYTQYLLIRNNYTISLPNVLGHLGKLAISKVQKFE